MTDSTLANSLLNVCDEARAHLMASRKKGEDIEAQLDHLEDCLRLQQMLENSGEFHYAVILLDSSTTHYFDTHIDAMVEDYFSLREKHFPLRPAILITIPHNVMKQARLTLQQGDARTKQEILATLSNPPRKEERDQAPTGKE